MWLMVLVFCVCSCSIVWSNASNSSWPSDSIDFTTFPGAPTPHQVFFCTDAFDVAASLSFQNAGPFAVRSGRHSYTLFSLAANGTVIDVSRMKQMLLSTDKSFVTFGAGVLNWEAQQFLAKSGLAHVGGTGPHVGAGLNLLNVISVHMWLTIANLS